jgi:hypothetical protein
MLIDNQKNRKLKSILVLTYLGIFKGTTDLFHVFLQVICKTNSKQAIGMLEDFGRSILRHAIEEEARIMRVR